MLDRNRNRRNFATIRKFLEKYEKYDLTTCAGNFSQMRVPKRCIAIRRETSLEMRGLGRVLRKEYFKILYRYIYKFCLLIMLYNVIYLKTIWNLEHLDVRGTFFQRKWLRQEKHHFVVPL